MWGDTGGHLIRSGVQLFPDRQTMLKTQVAGMKHFIDMQKNALRIIPEFGNAGLEMVAQRKLSARYSEVTWFCAATQAATFAESRDHPSIGIRSLRAEIVIDNIDLFGFRIGQFRRCTLSTSEVSARRRYEDGQFCREVLRLRCHRQRH